MRVRDGLAGGTVVLMEPLPAGEGRAEQAEVAAPNPRPQRRRPGIDVIPERVRRAREDAGLSLADLADGKVSRTAIHLIEAGRARPSSETLAHIAARTGRPVGYFLGGDAGRVAPDPTESSRRAEDHLRQASWALGNVVTQPDLTEPERTAVHGLLMSTRLAVRLLIALREAHAEK